MDQDHEQSHVSSPSTKVARHRDTVEPGHSSRSALLRKPDHAVASGLVRRKARDANGVADGAAHAVAAASSSSGAPLPAALMRKFEGSLGADLSGVRTHTGDASAGAADAVGAKAYTTGNDIHFGAGHYDPASSSGQHLLAHEVAHTVQQSGGAQRMQRKPEVSSPGDGLEREADRAADAMVSGGAATVSGASGLSRQALQRDTSQSWWESISGAVSSAAFDGKKPAAVTGKRPAAAMGKKPAAATGKKPAAATGKKPAAATQKELADLHKLLMAVARIVNDHMRFERIDEVFRIMVKRGRHKALFSLLNSPDVKRLLVHKNKVNMAGSSNALAEQSSKLVEPLKKFQAEFLATWKERWGEGVKWQTIADEVLGAGAAKPPKGSDIGNHAPIGKKQKNDKDQR